MDQPAPKIETVASLHLQGERFRDFGMPADNAKEVSALNELIYQLIELRWRERNPQSSRLPNGFRERYELRIRKIEPGSATPLLERTVSKPDAPALFDVDEDELTRLFKECVEEAELILWAAENSETLPESVFKLPLPSIRGVGSTLRDGESLQVGYGEIDDWGSKPIYTPASRRYLLEQLGKPRRKEVTYRGLVRSTNVSSGTFTFIDSKSRVLASAPYDQGFYLDINGEDEQTWAWVEVEGTVEFTEHSNTESFVFIETVTSRQLTPEFNRLQTRLDEIRDLETGWADGEDDPVFSEQQCENAQAVLTAAVEAGHLPTTVSPSLEGAIVLSWIAGDTHFSVEVEPEGSFYFHKSNVQTMAAEDGDYNSLSKRPSDLIDEWVRRSVK